MAPPAPVIEGSLKNTIHALAFGLITTTLAVNFGKLFLPHFFPFMMAIVIFVEAVLFSLDRPKENYDKYQPAGIKGMHTIEGAGSPQITVSAPGEDPEATPKKQGRIKDKLKTKKDQKGRRESGAIPGSPTKQSPRQSLSVSTSPGMDAIDGATEEKGKNEKEKKKEEEKGKKKEKEEEKERQKAEKKEEKERAKEAKESEEDKSEKSTWRKKRLSKKQLSE